MATNNFKPFATGTGANVLSQADYEALAALVTGFTSGKASSAQVNKALRQSTFIAAALAQYVTNKSGQDVLDNGDVTAFITKMATAFGKDFQALDAGLTSLAALVGGANMLPYYTAADVFAQTSLTTIGRSLIGQTTQAAALSYLGGAPLASPALTGTPTAPTAAVGTNTTQIATMAALLQGMLAFGLGGAAVVITDLNTASSATQFYKFARTAANIPLSGADGCMLRIQYSSATYTDIVITLSGTNASLYNRVFTRVCDNGVINGWTEQGRLDSPAFTGTPTVPTADVGTSTTQVANTAYVQNTFSNIGLNLPTQTVVSAFNWQTATFTSGQSQVVDTTTWLNAPSGLTLTAGDVVVINVLLARTTSTRFVVEVVSQSTGSTNRYKYLVTINGASGSRTFYVSQEFTSDSTTVIPIANGGTGQATAAAALLALGGAPLVSPALTGTPTAPTAAAGTSTTQLATTAFVTAADNLKANLASPTFTGTPAAPTAAAGTSTTQLATTAFVGNAITAASGRLLNVQTFTSSGTYTPTTGTIKIVVEALGGGGGAGGCAAGGTGASTGQGGAAGSYAKAVITSGFSSVAVTIGAAGTGGTAGTNNGVAGGSTSFGSLLSVTGGARGLSGASITPPSAGESSTINTGAVSGTATPLFFKVGEDGWSGILFNTISGGGISGRGGSSDFGHGGGSVVSQNNGDTASGYGSGGGGGISSSGGAAQAGGAGTAGLVIVWEYA